MQPPNLFTEEIAIPCRVSSDTLRDFALGLEEVHLPKLGEFISEAEKLVVASE